MSFVTKNIKPLLLLFIFILLTACESMPKVRIPSIGKTADSKIKPLDEDVFLPKDSESETDSSVKDLGEYIRIAVLLPLSGNASKIGSSLRNSALMAQYEVAPDNMVLQFYDTGGDSEKAIEATKDAISHGARLIIGPVFSASVNPVARIANARGVNVITFSNDPYVVGDGVYTIGLMINQQVDRILNYAKNNGYQKFAILAPDNDTGLTIIKSAENLEEKIAVEISKVGYYDPATNDFSEVVKDISDYTQRVENLKIEKENLKKIGGEVSRRALEKLETMETFGEIPFEAILLADEGTKLRSLSSMLSYYDVFPSKIKFLGTSLWDDASLIRENALIGGWYTALPKEVNNSFQRRYENHFNSRPPRLASLAYDAVALAAAIAKNNNQTRFSKNELTNPNGFAGIDGIFRLHPSGHSERGLAIMEMTREGGIIIDPAPESFIY